MGWEYITGPNFLVGNAANLPSGATLQTQYAATTALIVATTTMAGANTTIPQKTDGTQILSVTITPNAATNSLLITGVVPVAVGSPSNLWQALFQDANATAISSLVFGNATGVASNPALSFLMTAGTTGPTTFKVNVGNFNASNFTFTVNGVSQTQVLGTTMRATLVVQEIKV